MEKDPKSHLVADHNHSSLAVFRWDNPDVRSTVRIVDSEDVLGEGYEGLVKRVTVYSQRAPERGVIFASKLYKRRSFASNKENFDRYMLLKKSKLPTPRTFRSREDGKGALMTDLTNGGKNVVISSQDITAEEIARLYEQKPELMEQLSQGEDIFSVRQNKVTQNYRRKATRANIRLGRDTWFAIIKPDGAVEYITCDFSSVVKSNDKKLVSKFNKNSIEGLRQRLQAVQMYGEQPDLAIDMLQKLNK